MIFVMDGSSSVEPGIDRALNGIASMFLFDTDDDADDDGEPKPSELYGTYTWKIEKFSQTNKRELRSNLFEIGGLGWYILLYPQGCDVEDHMSLFLCTNHTKLIPGWSLLAQFTMVVCNKDPRKSKYCDTLHRFWKKEHDWGWKKFLQLSKLQNDGFLDDDTLTIKVQAQVIRDRTYGLFRCLESCYRSELTTVYMSNVEKICIRFMAVKCLKMMKVIEDKVRWSSFCKFWRDMDQKSRHLMSSEKLNLILKLVKKQFFEETEVTTTLVMESLYNGLKALTGSDKARGKCVAKEAVVIENDTFILVSDALLLFKREAFKPLPSCEEKDHCYGGSGYIMDYVESDKRRLTELGQRTIETFVLAHVFSKIDTACQEVVASRMQHELILEEEKEARIAQSKHKAKQTSKQGARVLKL